MTNDIQLLALSKRLGRVLKARDLGLVTAESCTAGWVAKAITDVPGSSAWLECGYVTYSNAAKIRDLFVPQAVIKRHGAVSEPTAAAMAKGAIRASDADVSVAITGIAGPDGGVPGKPVGTVWFAVAMRDRRSVTVVTKHRLFRGDREAVRRRSVVEALRLVIASLST